MTTTLCLVTDRRRLAAHRGHPAADAESLLLTQIDGAIRGGIDLVQIREPDLDAGRLAALVRGAVRLSAGTATRIVVNDRVDVAVACGAHGVHLRERSLTAVSARRLVRPPAWIGRSVHDAHGAAAAGPVDYLIAGTMFATASKPAGPPRLGREGLAEIVAAASGIPVLAIGGISLDRVAEVARAGAAGVAAIGAFMPPRDVALMNGVEIIARSMRFAFDSTAELS